MVGVDTMGYEICSLTPFPVVEHCSATRPIGSFSTGCRRSHRMMLNAFRLSFIVEVSLVEQEAECSQHQFVHPQTENFSYCSSVRVPSTSCSRSAPFLFPTADAD